MAQHTTCDVCGTDVPRNPEEITLEVQVPNVGKVHVAIADLQGDYDVCDPCLLQALRNHLVADARKEYRAGPPSQVDYPDDEVVWLHGLLERVLGMA